MQDKLTIAQKRSQFEQEFWKNVQVGNIQECWPWIGKTRTTFGYGSITIGKLKERMAHRLAWFYTNGPIPKGECICHHCDNPPCCNPNHLFKGTKADNHRDCIAKGRNGHGAPRGVDCKLSKLKESDVLRIRDMYARGGISFDRLAEIFNVSDSNIEFIIHRHTWKHI